MSSRWVFKEPLDLACVDKSVGHTQVDLHVSFDIVSKEKLSESFGVGGPRLG